MKPEIILDYHNLYDSKKKFNREFKHKKKEITKTLSKGYRKNHSLWFKAMDIMIVLIILFNFGAIFTTNFLVVKAEPTIVLREANIVQAELNQIEAVPKEEGFKMMKAIYLNSLIWAVFIVWYIYNRNTIFSDQALYFMLFLLMFILILTGTDFINNFGYAVGRGVFG